MYDELRTKYDEMFTELVSKQSRFIRGAVEGKREEIWKYFDKLVRPYFADAKHWRAHCIELEEKKRMDHMAGGTFATGGGSL